MHREKSLIKSTQQNFSFKYGSMEILFELTKKNIFFFNYNKTLIFQIKITKLLKNERKIFVNSSKTEEILMKFYKSINIFFFFSN